MAKKKVCQDCGEPVVGKWTRKKKAEKRETFCHQCLEAMKELFPQPKPTMTNRKCRKCGLKLPSNRYFNHEECAPEAFDEVTYPSSPGYGEAFSNSYRDLAERLDNLEQFVNNRVSNAGTNTFNSPTKPTNRIKKYIPVLPTETSS